MKIKLHPLFFVSCIILIFFKQGLPMLMGVISVILHELGHAFMSKYFGYSLNKIYLLPFGAMLYGEENLDSKAERYIAISGPLVSLIIALILISFWWIIPTSYYYTKTLALINLNLFFVNLLPCYPLDGARLILSLSKDKMRALNGLRLLGIIGSILFFLLFIVSIFYSVNFTAGIFAIFLFIGATSEVDKKKSNYLFNSSFFIKQFNQGVEQKIIYVSEDITLLKMVKLLSCKYLVTFVVCNDNFDKKYEITEQKLQKLVLDFPLNYKIKELNL